MNKIEENIQKWETSFTTYLEFENKCSSLLNEIQVIKNNLKKLLGNQKQDDLLFYKSMIDNSYFFFTNSLKIKKLKLIKDLNHIWSELDSKKTVDELTILTFQNIIKDYKRHADDINLAKQNNTSLKWVKDDRIENLQLLENEMTEILDYHLKLIQFAHSGIELEKTFYCGK